MPSIEDVNISPGTGNVTFNTGSTGSGSTTTVSTQASVSQATYVVPANTSGNTFVNLTDGPGGFVPNALLYSGDTSLEWTSAPTTANQVLVWTGTNFVWQVMPSFTGVLSVVVPFTETSGTFYVATLADVTILNAKVVIKTAFGTNSTIDVGTTAAVNAVIPNATIIQSQIGIYQDELYIPLSSSTVIQIAVNAVNSSSGIATLILEYITGTE